MSNCSKKEYGNVIFWQQTGSGFGITVVEIDGIKSDNETGPHSYDKSGKSIAHNSWFNLDIGTLSVHCEDWSKEFEDIGWSDKLKVRLMSNTIMDFLRNVQYK